MKILNYLKAKGYSLFFKDRSAKDRAIAMIDRKREKIVPYLIGWEVSLIILLTSFCLIPGNNSIAAYVIFGIFGLMALGFFFATKIDIDLIYKINKLQKEDDINESDKEIINSLYDKRALISEFIKDLMERSEAGELGEEFKMPETYSDIISNMENDGQEGRVEFTREMQDFILKCIKESQKEQTANNAKNQLHNFLKNNLSNLGHDGDNLNSKEKLGEAINGFDSIEAAGITTIVNKTAETKYLYHK